MRSLSALQIGYLADVFAFGISVDQGVANPTSSILLIFPLIPASRPLYPPCRCSDFEWYRHRYCARGGITHPVIVNADLKSPVVREGPFQVKSTPRARSGLSCGLTTLSGYTQVWTWYSVLSASESCAVIVRKRQRVFIGKVVFPHTCQLKAD